MFRGKYGDYLKKKISKVFPALFASAVEAEQQKPAAAAAKAEGNFAVDFHPDKDAGAGADAKAAEERVATQSVFEWTALLHTQNGPLSDEEHEAESALRERLRLWNEENL